MPLSASVFAAVTARLSGAPDVGTTQYELDTAAKFLDFAAGIGVGQVSKLFADKRSLAASTGEDLDLAGSLLDPLGQPAVFSAVKVLRVVADKANVNPVVLGNAAANGFIGPFGSATHTIAVAPGGCIMLVNPTGWTVPAGTGDILHVLNGGAGTAVNYEIEILG